MATISSGPRLSSNFICRICRPLRDLQLSSQRTRKVSESGADPCSDVDEEHEVGHADRVEGTLELIVGLREDPGLGPEAQTDDDRS